MDEELGAEVEAELIGTCRSAMAIYDAVLKGKNLSKVGFRPTFLLKLEIAQPAREPAAPAAESTNVVGRGAGPPGRFSFTIAVSGYHGNQL